ncbi:MAG: alcohol dehydrogenase-like regulatory protein ErcA [Candidatus Competibacter sp.]|nr:alcohol dehydrogenase-like regulatory protein ErcA [Candidatus Contendobacter sp.]MDS4040619.1 alcohol dehydrogenase-like regulatory protein ErcA [Candidatus Competibacter sp.]
MTDTMMALRKFVAPEFVFGTGSRKLVARYAKLYGAHRALLVTDPGLIAAGWAGEVEAVLAEEDIRCTRFAEISPNPRDHEVMKGAAIFLENRCDIIVCVGGGSVMDCGKGIGVVTASGRHILDFEGIDQIVKPAPPLICVPTTAGTSADVSQFAIITDTEERAKIAIISKAVVPDISLIDPETLVTKNAYLTACTGIDVLVHAVEAFVSVAHSPVTDLHALEAVRLIHENLHASITRPHDIELRQRVMLASLHAGLAFSNASLGAVHAMAHSLGGYKDLPHGECNALLLDRVMAFNFDTEPERFTKIGEVMGIDLRGMTLKTRRRKILDVVAEFRCTAGVIGTLGDRRIRTDDVIELARKAVVDPCMVTNPRRAKAADIQAVYEEAL